MTPEQELELLKRENNLLNIQLQEANAILFEKEEEIALLKQNDADIAALQSRLDGQLYDLQHMQNIIGKKQQQAEGAADRETELNNELAVAYSLQQKYDELLTEYTYAQTQLQDIQHTLAEIKKRNELLQKMAAKTVELESLLENAKIETAALRDTIRMLQAKNDL